MNNHHDVSWHVIIISFVIALMLTVFPLFGRLAWLRPDFILLVLIFWLFYLPHRINVGTAFIVGLLAGLINGNLLGENALAYVIISYVISRYGRWMAMTNLISHGLMMVVILLTYKIIIFIIEAILNYPLNSSLYWLSLLSNLIVWPLVYLTLAKICRHFHIE